MKMRVFWRWFSPKERRRAALEKKFRRLLEKMKDVEDFERTRILKSIAETALKTEDPRHLNKAFEVFYRIVREGKSSFEAFQALDFLVKITLKTKDPLHFQKAFELFRDKLAEMGKNGRYANLLTELFLAYEDREYRDRIFWFLKENMGRYVGEDDALYNLTEIALKSKEYLDHVFNIAVSYEWHKMGLLRARSIVSAVAIALETKNAVHLNKAFEMCLLGVEDSEWYVRDRAFEVFSRLVLETDNKHFMEKGFDAALRKAREKEWDGVKYKAVELAAELALKDSSYCREALELCKEAVKENYAPFQINILYLLKKIALKHRVPRFIEETSNVLERTIKDERVLWDVKVSALSFLGELAVEFADILPVKRLFKLYLEKSDDRYIPVSRAALRGLTKIALKSDDLLYIEKAIEVCRRKAKKGNDLLVRREADKGLKALKEARERLTTPL